MFRNRQEAGQQLAIRLSDLQGSDPLVLGVPRGGLEVAYQVYAQLGGRLDLIMAKKIPAPGNPELAVGAVALDGTAVVEKATAVGMQISDEYIDKEKETARREIQRRLFQYRGEKPYPQVRGKLVVVVDDGVATGATISAALGMLSRQEAASTVLAVPVAAPGALKALRRQVDRLECLLSPGDFFAVGQYYQDFKQTSDERVKELLQLAWVQNGIG